MFNFFILRHCEESLASADTRRSSSYGLFHHRSNQQIVDSSQQNTSLLPPSSVATPKDTLLRQDVTPESIFPAESLLNPPLLHQVPNDKLYMSSIIDNSTHKFISKPFVSLDNPVDAWVGADSMKSDEIDYTPYPPPEPDLAIEIQKPVRAFSTIFTALFLC